MARQVSVHQRLKSWRSRRLGGSVFALLRRDMEKSASISVNRRLNKVWASWNFHHRPVLRDYGGQAALRCGCRIQFTLDKYGGRGVIEMVAMKWRLHDVGKAAFT